MNLAIEPRKLIIPTITAASGRFGPFKPQIEKAVRIAKVGSNPFLEEIKRDWERHEVIVFNGGVYERQTYDRILADMKHGYSANDIEDFSIVLGEFQGGTCFSTKAGLYLSALINSSEEENFVVHTTAFAEPIISIGYCNTKNITVIGDAGQYVGDDMEKGTIIVKGNAGDDVGWHMKGGSITIEGNAGECAGCHMRRGAIIVTGNADRVGDHMRGGEIRING